MTDRNDEMKDRIAKAKDRGSARPLFLVKWQKGVRFMQYSAQYFIDKLNLVEHPEGGYYISSFRSAEEMAVRDVTRPIYTSIYFYYVHRIFPIYIV